MLSNRAVVGALVPMFTGKERDTESGNDYFGARYFGSSMGRFLSPDPSQLYYANPAYPQSLNLYSYVQNNPLSRVDPNGLDCIYTSNLTSTSVTVTTVRGDCINAGGKDDNGVFVDGTVNTDLYKAQVGSDGDVHLGFGYSNDDSGSSTDGTIRANSGSTDIGPAAPEDDRPQLTAMVKGVARNTAGFPTICSVGGFYYYGKGVTAFGAKGFVGGIAEYDSQSGLSGGSLVEGGFGTVGGGRIDSTHGTSYLGYKELGEIPFGASFGGLGYHDVGGHSGIGAYAESESGGRERGVGAYASFGTIGECH